MTITDTARREVSGLAAPAATRVPRPRWRSPQLIIGVLLVLASVVLGVRIVAAADRTVPVLAAARDISAGEPYAADLVETRHVVLDGLHRYVTEAPPDGHVIVRDVGAGELLPASAVAEAGDAATGDAALRFVTVAVPNAETPAGLARGDAVDVWALPTAEGEAAQLASAVTVTHIDTGGTLGMSGSDATVTLAVTAAESDDPAEDLDALVGRLITAGRDGRIYLARLP